MVLLAAYCVLLGRRADTDDVIALTTTAGRPDPRFFDTVGPFYNPLPLRVDLSGCETFREVVRRTRATCLEAYTHDLPFPLIAEQAPGLTETFHDPHRAVMTFELLQAPSLIAGETVGGLTYHEIRDRRLPQTTTSAVHDGVLWALDPLPSGELLLTIKAPREQFEPATIDGLAQEYQQLLRSVLAAPDQPLRNLTRTSTSDRRAGR